MEPSCQGGQVDKENCRHSAEKETLTQKKFASSSTLGMATEERKERRLGVLMEIGVQAVPGRSEN